MGVSFFINKKFTGSIPGYDNLNNAIFLKKLKLWKSNDSLLIVDAHLSFKCNSQISTNTECTTSSSIMV